jgi:CRISPR-associated protein Csm5
LIGRHRDYAQRTGLTRLDTTLGALEARLKEIRSAQTACVLSIGWGGGLLGKSAYLNTEDESYRKILRQMPLYSRAIQTGMPFPKTRRVIFEGSQPASLPGWVLLEIL